MLVLMIKLSSYKNNSYSINIRKEARSQKSDRKMNFSVRSQIYDVFLDVPLVERLGTRHKSDF